MGGERTAEPGQLVDVEEPGEMVPRVLGDAETGVAVAFAASTVPDLGRKLCTQWMI